METDEFKGVNLFNEWGSCNFMHSRGDVRSFLQSACAFWLDQYHFDGLRYDAVGNLINWQGNPIDFVKNYDKICSSFSHYVRKKGGLDPNILGAL